MRKGKTTSISKVEKLVYKYKRLQDKVASAKRTGRKLPKYTLSKLKTTKAKLRQEKERIEYLVRLLHNVTR